VQSSIFEIKYFSK